MQHILYNQCLNPNPLKFCILDSSYVLRTFKNDASTKMIMLLHVAALLQHNARFAAHCIIPEMHETLHLGVILYENHVLKGLLC